MEHQRFGLLIDLTDPFKFADGEKMLRAVTVRDLDWRDFAADRHGMRFCCPKLKLLWDWERWEKKQMWACL